MMKTLRRRFIVFAMAAVSALLLVLVVAISTLCGVLLNRQSDMILETLVNAEGLFNEMRFERAPFLAPPIDMDSMQATRFFTVRMNEAGVVTAVNIEQISSVSVEEASSYAAMVDDYKGHVAGYKYAVKTLGTERLVVFMDMGAQTNTLVMVVLLSASIALACWLVALAFVVFFSGRVVRPIVAGIEKQKQFITNAGHELKTPLAIIQSNNDASMLLYGETKYSNNIKLQTQRLNMLMTNLLTLAKLDESATLPMAVVNLSPLVETALVGYEDACRQKGVALHSVIAPDVTLLVHRETFVQMVSALLDNAIKYTVAGGDIVVSLTEKEGRVTFIEENSCEGDIDMDLERLFERFYRGDAARTQDSASSGFGIGLSAARMIAESFGGTLSAEWAAEGRIRFIACF